MVVANGCQTRYVYNAAGVKLKRLHITAVDNIVVPLKTVMELSGDQILTSDTTEYRGNFIFENGRLDKVLFSSGYVSCNSDNEQEYFTFHYYVKDHLGNNRAVVGEDGHILQWDRPDPLADKYYPVSPYVYCMDNPVNAIDPDGRIVDWYQDKDQTYQYSPNVHSQKDLSKGQRYISKSFTTGKGHNLVQYRADGSILYNKTAAYNRMWNQADVHFRQMGEKWGREVGGFIITSGKVLVLPDYLNDFDTSEINKYGYSVGHGTLRKGKESFNISGQIHTHQSKSFDATPSDDDAIVSNNMGGLPVFSIAHDNLVHGVYWNFNKHGYSELEFNMTRKQLLTGKL